ncbi:MAG: CHAP domain-containing protein [Blastocatellales bacterium]
MRLFHLCILFLLFLVFVLLVLLSGSFSQQYAIAESYHIPNILPYGPEPYTGPIKPKPKKPTAYNPCNCVAYVSWRTHGNVVRGIGLARNHPINSKLPEVGAILITNESASGHLAYVQEVARETITISEANYERCAFGTRTIRQDSPVIIGYYIY